MPFWLIDVTLWWPTDILSILEVTDCIDDGGVGSILPSVMLLFLYSAVIFFHSSTLGTPARRTASNGSVTAWPDCMSRSSIKETGMRPGPPRRPIGLATNHSGLDWAMTMMASPALASNSSGRSAWKSYCTMP